MTLAIQNFETKMRSQTAKNTLPKTKITLLTPKLRSQKPRLRSWNLNSASQKPRLRSWQPKLRSQKPRLRSWNLNSAFPKTPRLRSQKNISGNWISELPAFYTYALKGLFNNFSKLHNRFGWISGYFILRSHVKCRVNYL